jgi:hypothetical protein
LTIALLPKDAEDPNSGIGGVRSLTLARIDRLHLAAQGGGLLPELPRQGKQPAAAAAAPLEVTCRGPFVFDVPSETAIFDEGVVVEQVHPAGPPDKLTCRTLLLAFADESEATRSAGASPSQVSPSQASPSQADPLAGRLKRVVAIGSPVTLEAPSAATRAVAARIEYSLVKRRLALAPGENAAEVSLKQGQNEFTARELEYELAEPGGLGRMWAAGPGQLKFVQMAGPARQTIVAQWDKELRIQPDGRHQVISLVESASIAAEPLGRFAADELHVWVTEQRTEDRGQRTEDRGPKTEERVTILPDRLLAAGRVEVKSPRLNVTTYRLEAWFQNLPPKPQPLPPIEPIQRAVHLQAAEAARARREELAIQPPSPQHFDLAGDLIQMQILRQGEALELENLTIRGHVVLDELQTPQPGQKPIRITGERLELRGGVTGAGKIDVAGQPAEVGGRGLTLAGSEIHLVRAENRLWIEGPGEAKLPAGEPASGKRELADRPRPDAPGGLSGGLRLALAGDVHVVWQDGLTFDGQTALISGEVQARTATQLATCKTLELTLTRRIDFAAATSGEQPEMGRLTMDGGVSIVSRSLNEKGEQQSLDRVQLQDLAIDRTAGTLNAAGPGWVTSTRLPTATLPGGPLPGGPLAGRPPADPAAPPQLNHIHVDFQGGIVGNLARREMEIQRQVRTTFIPVRDWDEQVVIERLEDLGEKGVLMTSERLTVIEMTPAGQQPWIEASASGNAIVDGKNFKVSAPRISYTSDKEVLTLEGDGRADAELWYQTLPGQPSSYGAARKWRYWLRTGMFDVEDARPLEFQLNGIDKIRLPGRR